jgi:hypothetical protein
VYTFFRVLEDVGRPRTKLVQPSHHVTAFVLVVEQRQRGERRQFSRPRQFFLDFGMEAT